MHPFCVHRLTKRPFSSVQALPLETIPTGENKPMGCFNLERRQDEPWFALKGKFISYITKEWLLKELLVVNRRQEQLLVCITAKADCVSSD